MARAIAPTRARTLTPAQRREAEAKLRKMQRENPLRTVRMTCSHGPVRDALAAVGDWIWCEKCAGQVRVVSVRE